MKLDLNFVSCITGKRITKELWTSDSIQAKYESCMIYVNKNAVSELRFFNCFHRSGLACQVGSFFIILLFQ
jgi:hypothetical protein